MLVVCFLLRVPVSAPTLACRPTGGGWTYGGAPTEEGVAIEDALSGECCEYRQTLEVYPLIEEAGRGAQPARDIAQMQSRSGRLNFTQNVDGPHGLAGPSASLIFTGTSSLSVRVAHGGAAWPRMRA